MPDFIDHDEPESPIGSNLGPQRVLSELRAQKCTRLIEYSDALRLLLGSCLYQCLQGGRPLEERLPLFLE